jgi:SAM-dependent methyltransferase
VQYRFALESRDYSHYAPGRALVTRRGSPAFPVRLAEEIFLQAAALLREEGRAGPYTVYDPACGSGYLLAVVALLFNGEVSRVVGSDIDPEALEFSAKNLTLLDPSGLAARQEQLRADRERYGRASADEALESCRALEAALVSETTTRVFPADALGLDLTERLAGEPVDMVLTDIPHGSSSRWSSASGQTVELGEGAQRLLRGLCRALGTRRPVVALASQKGLSAAGAGARRLRRFAVGRRQVLYFRLEGEG